MSENITSTTIAEGLVLLFDPDRAHDALSEHQLERARLVFDRSAQRAELRAIVQHLVDDAGREAEQHLEHILSVLGWSSTRTAPLAELAAAVEALADVVDGPRLAQTVETAELEMHKWWGRREEMRSAMAPTLAALAADAAKHGDAGALHCVLEKFLRCADVEQLGALLEAAAACATDEQRAAMAVEADEQREIMRESCDGSCGKAAS